VCLIRIKEKVGEKRSTVCTHRYADCLLKNTSIKHNKYVVNQKQGLLKKNEKKLARCFNFTFRYIDDVLSLNNSRFGDFVDRIYSIEIEIKDTSNTNRSAALPKGTLGSVASLLAATLYQGNPDRNHKLWNIVSSERYIFHMQVLQECCYI
jgi:hypothetical protein